MAAEAPPEKKHRPEAAEQSRAPPLFIEEIANAGPARGAFDAPFQWRFTVRVATSLSEPFDVVAKWVNLADEAKDMVMDEVEVDPIEPTNGAPAVFELETDPLDLANLTFDETELLDSHCVEVVCRYRGATFAAQTFEVRVSWADPKHETDMPDAVEAKLLRREIMVQPRGKRVRHYPIRWGLPGETADAKKDEGAAAGTSPDGKVEAAV